jgi:tetratricopeptide (TPR) repeat protein
VSSFQKALALNPENARYRNNLATAYVKSGQEAEALAAFRTGNDDAKANMNVARVYYRDGEYAKAEAYYRKAARSKPKDGLLEKELAAAGSLAEIHAVRKTVAPDNQKKASESTQVVASRYDKEGYYTVPAVPVEDFDSTETVAVPISDTNFNEAVAAVEMDYTIVASASGNDLIEKPLAPTEPLLLSRLQPVDESKVQELLHSNLNDLNDNPQKRIKIEVSNGNGVRHMAKQVGHFLKEQNVIIMYLSNADHFNYHDTSIYYTKGNLWEALRLSQKLPGRQLMQEVDEIRKGNADISVLIGKDLVPHLEALKES